MARWTDLAEWRGPTPNQTKGVHEQRGGVVHIASGFYEGTISWQKNPDVNVSSHFVIARDGKIAQMVDTADTAWTQQAGNGHWLSFECEGFSAGDKDPNGKPWLETYPGWDVLTDAQLTAVAKLFYRGHVEYGYPLQLATDPDGHGLGHHSMGCNWPDGAWGHCFCPGDPIIAQKPEILRRAQAMAGGTGEDEDMGASFGPIDIQVDGVTSLCIPPVEQGLADPRPAWLNIANDTQGADYALRLWGCTSKGWGPIANAAGEVLCHSGGRYSYGLIAGTYCISIQRLAISVDGSLHLPEPFPAVTDVMPYEGHLTVCIERGAVK